MKKRFVLVSVLMCLVCCLFGLAACGDGVDTFDVTVSSAFEHGTLTPDKTEAAEGETVTVTATPENGYSFKENSLTVNGEAQQGLTFTMPAENVELSATFVKDTVFYTVTLTTDTSKGTLSASKTKAEAGETITVTPHPEAGWAISAVKLDGTALTASSGVYSFKMPEKNVTVTGEFVEAVYNITIDPVEHVTITADKSTAKYNEQVTLTVSADTGFVVGSILVNGSPSSTTFTMPAEDVVITAEVTQVSGENFGYTEDIGLDPIPASNWDLSHDFGTGAYITVQSTSNALIYHTTAPEAEFYFESKITVNETKPAAVNPATGITIRSAADNGQRVLFYANVAKNVFVMNAQSATDNFLYAWEGDRLGSITNDFEGGGGFTLGVAKKGMYLYFFIDGQFAAAKMYPNLSGTCYIGFLMFDDCRNVKYSDYSLTTTASEVDTKIGNHLVVDGANFGYSTEVPVTPSAGWDLSEDNGANPKLKLNTEGNATIFLKQASADFYFSTKINIAEVKAGDGNPTTGIVVQKASDPAKRIYFYLRAVGLATTNEVMVMTGKTADLFDYNWSGDEVAKAGKAYNGDGNFITLGLLKKGNTLYFYVNDVVVSTETKWADEVGTTDTCYIGLQKMGVNQATYFDYTFTKDVNSMFHTVTMSQDVTNGTLVPSKTTAVKGETITVTTQAESGYFFKAGSLTVNGTQQEGLTFTMPDENVVLGGTFEEVKEEYNITLNFEDALGTLTASAEKASEGMLVTLTVEPKHGAYLEKVTTLVGETETPIEYNNGYSFTMPDQAVTVKAYFYTGANFGYSDAVPVDPQPADGWDVLNDKGANPKLVLNATGNAMIFLKQSAADFYFSTKINIAELDASDGNPTTGIVVRKASDPAQRIYFYLRAVGLATTNDIRVMTGASGDMFHYNWSGDEVAKAGKAYNGDDNYITLGLLKKGGTLYFYVNDVLVSTETKWAAQVGTEDLCYIGLQKMGVNQATYFDYTFTTEVDSMFHTITTSEEVTNGTLTPNKTTAVKGETITVTVKANAGFQYTEDSLTVNGQEQEGLTFTMPDEDVELGATFTEIEGTTYGITLDFEGTLGTLEADMEQAAEGTTVTLTVTPNRGVYLEKVTVTLNGNEETVIQYNEGYSFEMPAQDVTVKAYFYKGENFGYSADVPEDPTDGWNLLNDNGDEATLGLDCNHHAIIYLNKAAVDFYFEMRLNIAELNPADGNPTTGIIIRKNANDGLYFHLKALNLGETNEIRIMSTNDVAKYDFNWSGMVVGHASKPYSGGAENYISLAVAKLDGIMYFFIDGKLEYVGSTMLGANDNCYVGLMSMGLLKATWSNYSFITDKTEVGEKLGSDKITEAKAPAWTEGLTSVSVKGSGEFDGKGVTFYAKRVEGGIKIAAVATHSKYVASFKGAGDWWQNTNLEIWSGSGEPKHHFITACISCHDEIGDLVSFYTVYDAEKSLYTTVAECFITDANLTIEGDAVRLGLAWKTPGDSCNNGADLNGAASEWWHPQGHMGTDAAQQYYVTENGILDSAPAKA